MDDLVLLLGAAFLGGWIATWIRLPPLVGFLVTGFVLNASGVQAPESLDQAADLGVALLLFSIGLKFDVRVLLRREVWVTTSLHLLVSTGLVAVTVLAAAAFGLSLLDGLGAGAIALLAVGLAFSSTVFVIKVLEQNNATRSFYGVTAIGILVFQDLVAVAVVTVSSGELPSIWAPLVLLLPLARPVLQRLLTQIGRGELQVVLALTLALGPGYLLFDTVGLKGDLGALVMGMLLASGAHADVVRRAFSSIKELLLVAFFLSLGFVGVPGAEHLALAGILALLIPLKVLGFAYLLKKLGLRHRSAGLGGLALGNFSEFGLIVAVAGVDADLLTEDQLVVVAAAVALSFLVSSVANALPERALPMLDRLLGEEDTEGLHDRDRIIDVGGAHAVVLGLGRVGRSAYGQLEETHGLAVLGVETDPDRVATLQEAGLNVLEADATDPEFWTRLRSTGEIEIAVLAMPFHGANRTALRRLRESGFDGVVGVVAQYDEDLEDARRHGADTVLHLYDGTGAELADRTVAQAGQGRPSPDDGTPDDS